MRLIDADAIKYHEYLEPMGNGMYLHVGIVDDKEIDAMPTVDAVPVIHGKWITEECLPGVAVCSICGHEIRGIGCQYTKYCDECGARMDEDEKKPTGES